MMDSLTAECFYAVLDEENNPTLNKAYQSNKNK
jgi:hypothetical protein